VKYHDSIEQADEKMHIAAKQLQLWYLPATPINYAVSYEFISKKNKALNSAIENQLALGQKLDNFFIEEIYRQFVLNQSKFRDEIIDDIEDIVCHMVKDNKTSSKCIEKLVTTLDNNIANIQSSNKETALTAIKLISQATKHFKIQQQKLAEHLVNSHQKSNNLKAELEEVRKEVYMDPLTGLYNQKAMSQNMDLWLTENPERQVAAIVINIDQFQDINQKFGSLISDVLLNKIATKVISYVGDSGLPIRSGGNEFLILLPDIKKDGAGEIAEKIRQGVEKLRFVSSKSGIRLPQMTLSIGVNDFNIKDNPNGVIKKTRLLLTDMQFSSQNQVKLINES
jgi:diguanylate cyclase